MVRLFELAVSGTAPLRMVRETQRLVGGWQGTNPDRARQWAMTLRDGMAAGLATAIERAEKVEASNEPDVAKQAEAVVVALRAAVAALVADLSGL